MISIEYAYLLDAGGRKINEDYCSCLELTNYACFVLADGLGGHIGGEVASKLAVEGALKAFESSPGMGWEDVQAFLEYAMDYIKTNKGVENKHNLLKTTLVVLITDYVNATWAHTGDSRLYYFSGGKIIFQTKDHSVPQAMVNAGEIKPERIRRHEDRNHLTKVFDEGAAIRFDYNSEPVMLQKGDVFLLCSDGFWEYVYEKEMEKTLKKADNPKQWLSLMENKLLKRVRDGHDNYSAIAVMTGNLREQKNNWIKRLLGNR